MNVLPSVFVIHAVLVPSVVDFVLPDADDSTDDSRNQNRFEGRTEMTGEQSGEGKTYLVRNYRIPGESHQSAIFIASFVYLDGRLIALPVEFIDFSDDVDGSGV